MRADLTDELICPASGSPLRLTALLRSGDDVEYGLLAGPSSVYPIIEGIPVLLPDQGRLVRLLREGRFEEATVIAAFGDASRSRARRTLRRLGSSVVGGPGASLDRWLERRQVREGTAILFPRHESTALSIIEHGYLRVGSVDAYNYFAYRWSMPRHLVGLSIASWLPFADTPVLDVGCGGGHLTRFLLQREPDRAVLGIDPVFFLLLAARRHIAPGADLLCADARRLPFRDGVFGAVFSSDVFTFIAEKSTAAQECERVLVPDGWLALTSLKNASCEHLYAGDPLTVSGWRELVAHLPHRLLPDSEILSRYLRGVGPAVERDRSDAELSGEPLVSVLATKGHAGFVDGGPFSAWPHSLGSLGVNPLFQAEDVAEQRGSYVRTFPDGTYERDNASMDTYLPSGFALAPSSLERARRGGRDDEIRDLLARVALVGLPERYGSPVRL